MEKYTRVSRGSGKTDSNKGLCDDKQNATYMVGLVQLRKPKPSSRITSVGKAPETLWDPTKHMFIIREPRGLICASLLVRNHQELILVVLKISQGRLVLGFTHLKQVYLHQAYMYSQISLFLSQILRFSLFTLQPNSL